MLLYIVVSIYNSTRISHMGNGEPIPGRNTEIFVTRSYRETTVTKPEGTFTYYYGDHISVDNRVDTWKPNDTIFLESGGVNKNYSTNSFEVMLSLKQLPYEGKKQYTKVIESAAKEHLPVMLADGSFSRDPVLMNIPVNIGETAIGAALLYQFNKLKKISTDTKIIPESHKLNSKKLSRRDFLRALVLTGAAYMFSPTVSDAINVTTTLTNTNGDTADSIYNAVSTIHPEVDLLEITVRNVILAHKQQWYAEKLGNKPHFHTYIGTNHVALDNIIQESPDHRIAFLNSIKPLLNTFIVPETLYSLVEMRNEKGPWLEQNHFEVPELKALT